MSKNIRRHTEAFNLGTITRNFAEKNYNIDTGGLTDSARGITEKFSGRNQFAILRF